AVDLFAAFLSGETLDDADAADGFGEIAGESAAALGGGAGEATEAGMEAAVDQPDQRAEEEQDEKERPVVVEHQRGGTGHLTEEAEAEEKHLLQTAANGLDVGDDPGEDAAELGLVEITERHALEVGEDVVAQVMDDGLAELEL